MKTVRVEIENLRLVIHICHNQCYFGYPTFSTFVLKVQADGFSL